MSTKRNTTLHARIALDHERVIGQISPLLFGGFAEHMGRCIYEGLYEPGSPLADAHGIRTDVIDALRELGMTTIRYPGGNFLSGYNWRDGIGPRDQRPRRRELAWHSIETNQFGLHEFIDVCRRLNSEPMLGVNLGTGTIEEAGAMVEYCNAPTGSINADLRKANGSAEPFGVKYWCLGNEMDGPWQIGHLNAEDYAKKAREAAKIMRWHDPSIALVLCGSSGTGMSTYPEWDRLVLEHCYDQIDYLSLHYYANNHANDSASYLALARQFEDHLDTLAATIRYVKAKLRSKREVYLSWDEWNVWYKDRTMDGGWSEAPHLIEEIYNLEDALVVAQWMSVFLRRCDVLHIACIAQIVNVIAPLLTRRDGLLRQSTYYPFLLYSRHARGTSLQALVDAPLTPTAAYDDVPMLDVAASYDEEHKQGAVFIVNRSLSDSVEAELRWTGQAPKALQTIERIAGDDPKQVNSFEHPDRVGIERVDGTPIVLKNGRATLTVPPLSLTVVTYSS